MNKFPDFHYLNPSIASIFNQRINKSVNPIELDIFFHDSGQLHIQPAYKGLIFIEF